MVWLELGYGLLIGGCAGSIATLYGLTRLGLLQERIFGMIDQYIESFAAELDRNPKFAARFVNPLLNAAMQQFNSGAVKEPTIKLPIIGRVPASMLQPFMGLIQKQFMGKVEDAVEKLPGMAP